MNRFAMLHIVDSSYCFPVSPNEIVLRLRTAKNDLVSARVLYESKYVIGQTHKEALMEKAYVGEVFDFYEVRLQLEDTRLAYVFYVNDGENNYYFSEDGITETYDFTVGFYNFFQYPYINEADIVKQVPWMKEAVFYQIFVDRFAIGDKSKNMNYVNLEWGQIPNPKSFAGGDIKGITEHLDYLQSLGVNSIYLTPVFESISNHKYDISDYYKVDPHFGSNEDLKELVEELHKRGMHILLDAVFNHCSENLAQFQDVVLNGKDSKYFDWFVIQGEEINEDRDNYEVFASCKYMPKFNTSNEEVQEYLMDIGSYYIKEYDIDGWRLDVSDEISHYFWRKFRERIKECKSDAVIIGENWHDANSNLRGDQFDSIMNYAFTKACLDYFAKDTKDAKEMSWKLNEILMRNTDPVNAMMMNLLDSHDTHRFFSEVKESPLRMKAALALLYMFPGAPCIFYGTELFTPGGFDPDCRRCMDWEKAKVDGPYRDVFALLIKLAELRKKYEINQAKCRIEEKEGLLLVRNEKDGQVVELRINLTKEDVTLAKAKVEAESFQIVVNGGIQWECRNGIDM